MEAAKLDGCGYFRTFLQIFMPLMKGALATQLMLWFMGIWNDYLAPTIFIQDEQLVYVTGGYSVPLMPIMQ
mgnify:CR=1 FL=1